MDDSCSGSSNSSRGILLGFGSVGRHLVDLILPSHRQAPHFPSKTSLSIIAIADSSGGLSCPTGLPLSLLLKWKLAGKPLISFTLTEEGEWRGSDLPPSITHHRGGTLQMVKDIAQPKDIILDTTPVNLVDGGVGLACCRWGAQHGVHLVLANKAPLVLSYKELLETARSSSSYIEFSATVCGGLPVINVGRRDLACCARLNLVQGIFNSTSNYVLSRMSTGEEPEKALEHAKRVGIAEADPSLDLEGYDTASKLVIICNSILNISATLQDVALEGITGITLADVEAAGRESKVYRLIATASRCSCAAGGERELEGWQCGLGCVESYKLSVSPTLVDVNSFFGQCQDTDMSVVFVSDEFETMSLKTSEKGVSPTSAAVLRDCFAIMRRQEQLGA